MLSLGMSGAHGRSFMLQMWYGDKDMATGRPKRPTDAELIILRVLWEHGPSTVREVNGILNETRPTGYTTTLKQMQVMTSKGLLVRNESRRPQVY
ncbi:unnamed protein product, partial [marine sediment metagenome]